MSDFRPTGDADTRAPIRAWFGNAAAVILAEMWSPIVGTLQPRMAKWLDEFADSEFPKVQALCFEVSLRDGPKLVSLKNSKVGFPPYGSMCKIHIYMPT